LQPGEKVIVHAGTYRECVRPARGGTAPDRMVAYEAADGDRVILRGSEVWSPAFTLSQGWETGGARTWAGALPKAWFVGYNPFQARNFSSEYTTFVSNWEREETEQLLLRRGMLFARPKGSDGDFHPLRQVYHARHLDEDDGTFWVEDSGLRLHLRMWGDADPGEFEFEVTVREQIFAPEVQELGYIRVSGFRFDYAADGVPVPQRAMVSAARGHHWIIEDNTLEWANACGLDVGNETWHRSPKPPEAEAGYHIIRRNTVRHCGICGIAAVGNNAYTLVENNLVEHVGHQHIERIWETGGLKFHLCDGVLIRRNVFRHIVDAPGIWLDYRNRNSRITENVIADVESLQGSIFLEVNHAPILVDHNAIWDIKGAGGPGTGRGINVDTGEECVIAHNLLGCIRDEYAVSLNLRQSGRIVEGRVGLCRAHRVYNNLFFSCPKRITLARTADNVSDGNLFDARDDATSFRVETPAPEALLDLAAWQRYYGFDRAGAQTTIEADFDPETLLLTLSIAETPAPVEVEGYPDAGKTPNAGPVALKPGRRTYRIGAGPPS
ncbi:MAG: right-handed parallel beta-helix repeat-containing protein, partial [Anaerolineae bacterium]